MKSILSILFFSILLGCQNRDQGQSKSPLSGFREFSVVAFYSPYSDLDKESLFAQFVKALEKVGEVKVEKGSLSKSDDSNALLFFSLGEGETGKEAAIKVCSKVEVQNNQFKFICPIWDAKYENPYLPKPVIEDDKVVFQQDPNAEVHPLSDEEVQQQVIEKFIQSYRDANPREEKPLFLVNTPVN